MSGWMRRRRRAGGRGSFAVWMLVTVGLLVPSQWYAYSRAMRPPGDQTFPISAWSDPRYFPQAQGQPRPVRPLLRRIIDDAASARIEPTPTPTSSGGGRPTPTISPKPTPTPTDTPTPSPSPTPDPTPPPRIEIRADAIDPPDSSNSLFYRWRIEVSNPTNGGWLDNLDVLTQVPVGTERVSCSRGFAVQAPGRNATPGYQCDAIPPPASNDGHDLTWTETQLGPGYVRVYTFEVRVTAADGATIQNHAHARWRGGGQGVTTKACVFVVKRSAPKACSASS